MCRSIKTLRPPALPEEATEEEIRADEKRYDEEAKRYETEDRKGKV